jgi:hypothetical protein
LYVWKPELPGGKAGSAAAAGGAAPSIEATRTATGSRRRGRVGIGLILTDLGLASSGHIVPVGSQ